MLDLDLVVPSSTNIGDQDNQQYWGSILASVQAKANASMCVLLHVHVPLLMRHLVVTPALPTSGAERSRTIS